MSLRLVKPGDAEADPAEVERAEVLAGKLISLAKSGGQYFVVLDGEEQEAGYLGDLLEISALAEEVARQAKLQALGLE